MEEKSRMYDALAEPGSSVTDVAQKFGVSYTTAWKWNEKFNNGLSKADFMQPGDSTRRLSMEERGRLWEALSVPDVNLTEVAREFKVSLGTVWKWNEEPWTHRSTVLSSPATQAVRDISPISRRDWPSKWSWQEARFSR